MILNTKQRNLDKWYAQIEQILMAEWKKSSRFYQATTSAKVRIRIDSKGRLSYLHMITQSPYAEYNSSVIAFLKNMEKRLFPMPPEGDIDTNLELCNIRFFNAASPRNYF